VDASRAGVLTAVARVDNDDRIGPARQRRRSGQGEEILLRVDCMDEEFSTNRTRRITE